jgi:hypothetical protein
MTKRRRGEQAGEPKTDQAALPIRWRSVDLDGLEPDIEAWGSDRFQDWSGLWQRICDAHGEDPKVPVDIALELAGLFANQVGDYIEGFARGKEVQVAKCIIYGLFSNYTYPDTDNFDDSTPPDSE